VKISLRGEDSLFAPFVLLNIKECSPLGVNEGVNYTAKGQSSPLVGQVHHSGQPSTLGPINVVKTGLSLLLRRNVEIMGHKIYSGQGKECSLLFKNIIKIIEIK
jgi:hypothetical protein